MTPCQQITSRLSNTHHRPGQAAHLVRGIIAEMRWPDPETIQRLQADFPGATDRQIRTALWDLADALEGR